MARRPEPTSSYPHRYLTEALRSLGYLVENEFMLGGRYFDIHILGTKLLIEVDGEYWHSSPEAYVNDRLKDDIAAARGYRVLRVSDTLVLEQLGSVISAIAETLEYIKHEPPQHSQTTQRHDA